MFQNQEVLWIDKPMGSYMFVNMGQPLKPQNFCVGV